MGEAQKEREPPPPETSRASSTPPSVSRDAPIHHNIRFDPSRMIGIIQRKSLIKDLAAVYHAECLTCCQELLKLQGKPEEPYKEIKAPNNLRKETTRPTKRVKKSG